MLSGSKIQPVQLEELATAFAHLEQQPIFAKRREPRFANRFPEERELLPRSARRFHVMNLHRVGETRRDQHLPASRVPRLKASRANVLIGNQLSDKFQGHLGNAFSDDRGWSLPAQKSREIIPDTECQSDCANRSTSQGASPGTPRWICTR